MIRKIFAVLVLLVLLPLVSTSMTGEDWDGDGKKNEAELFKLDPTRHGNYNEDMQKISLNELEEVYLFKLDINLKKPLK